LAVICPGGNGQAPARSSRSRKLGSWGNIAYAGCAKPWSTEKKAERRIRRKALIFFGATGFCIKAKKGGNSLNSTKTHLCKLRTGMIDGFMDFRNTVQWLMY
jgi:hypothetical protein